MTKVTLSQAEFDEVKRLKKKLNILGNKKRPKYWGDQYLIMSDFFDELNPEHRYLYFGGMLSDNQVNIMYGRLKPIAFGITAILDQYIMSKIAMAKAGKDIEEQLLRPQSTTKRPDIYS